MSSRMERRNEELKIREVEKNNRKVLKRFLLSLFLLIILITVGAVGYTYYSISRMTTKSNVAPKAIVITKPVNILILGVDAGDYNNHTKNNPNRSDTMMLVRYNPKTNRAYMLSIPRDTKAVLNGHIEKLNAAHAIGGVPFTIKTIEKLLDIDINYYAEINYEGFRECIDAIGGVDIKIPRDMNYDAWKISVHFKKGEVVHMNGEKAEEFVRWRKNNNGGGYPMGDLGRISTQQDFMVELVKKLKTPSGMVRMPALMNTVSKYVETNMPISTMFEYAVKARSIKPDMVQKEILPGEAKYIGNVSYYVWNKDLKDNFIDNFRGNESNDTAMTNSKTSEPSVDASNKRSTSTLDASGNDLSKEEPVKARGNMDVIILNSTGKPGLAAQYKLKLEKLGYKVTQTDNYVYKKYSYTIINDYSKNNYGSVLYNDLKFGRIVKKDKKKVLASLVVILGTDSIK